MKKVIAIRMSVLRMASMTGCRVSTKTPVERGEEVIALMSEMTENENVLESLSGSQEIKEKVLQIGTKEPEYPDAVYEVKLSKENLPLTADFEGISDSLKQNLIARSYAAVGPQLNALEGVEFLAASSMCTASISFKTGSIAENLLYIYFYRDGAPVMVSFSANADGIVTATGTYLFKDEEEDKFDALERWGEFLSCEFELVAGS